MSYYTTKSSNVERDYVVIRHGFRGMNSTIMGIRFRDGWAVVEKGSKIYFRLKKLPMLKNIQERPLSFLRELPFINRAADIKLIFGADIYAKYTKLITKVEAEEVQEAIQVKEKLHMEDDTNCSYRLENENLCRHSVQNPKVSSYCPLHILKDPRLEELNFVIPLAMNTKDRKKLRKRAFNKLEGIKTTEEVADVSVVEEQTPGADEQINTEA